MEEEDSVLSLAFEEVNAYNNYQHLDIGFKICEKEIKN